MSRETFAEMRARMAQPMLPEPEHRPRGAEPPWQFWLMLLGVASATLGVLRLLRHLV